MKQKQFQKLEVILVYSPKIVRNLRLRIMLVIVITEICFLQFSGNNLKIKQNFKILSKNKILHLFLW